MKSILKKISIVVLVFTTLLQCKNEKDADLKAILKTSKGTITLKMEYKKTPLTVSNFVALAKGQLENKLKTGPFYDGVKIHRVVEGFVLQAGDPSGTGAGDAGYSFKNEIDTNLKHNKKGVISMANLGSDGTNSTQFFITLKELPQLDGAYPVFGEIIDSADFVVLDSLKEGDEIINVEIVASNNEAKKFVEDAPKIMKTYIDSMSKINEVAKAKNIEIYNDYLNTKAYTKGSNENYLYKIITPNKSKKANQVIEGSTVKINYTGYFLDGTKFDSSVGREPIELEVGTGRVIPGWDKGLQHFKQGDKGSLFILPEAAYGDMTRGPIPANSILLFDIEIIEVKNK